MRKVTFRVCGNWLSQSRLPLPADVRQRVAAGRREFVADHVSGVAVKADRAGLHPYAWRQLDLAQRNRNGIHRINARSGDVPEVLRRVRTIDVLAGKIDDRVRALQQRRPRARVDAIPVSFQNPIPPLRGARVSTTTSNPRAENSMASARPMNPLPPAIKRRFWLMRALQRELGEVFRRKRIGCGIHPVRAARASRQ